MHRTKLKHLIFVFMMVVSIPSWARWGFDWDKWFEITKGTRPEVTSPQAGRSTLLHLLDTGSNETSIILTVPQWEKKRETIKAVLSDVFGETPDLVNISPIVEEVGREDLGSYERIDLRITSEVDDIIPAYYLRPKSLMSSRSPIMIVLHQTQAPGKKEAVGMTGDQNMAFAKELVELGIPCIVPDAIGFGERIPRGGQPYDKSLDFYRKHPGWSYFGKMNWDISRIIDYLETLPEVDPDRIGIMGHSHGAYGSIMAAVFDDRISLVVASCGFTMLRSDTYPARWSRRTALMPRLAFYLDDISQVPFDWHEIIAGIAPRPYFNWATLNDRIFPNTKNFTEVYEQVGEVYALYNKRDNFVGKLAPGSHHIPLEIRQEAYEWIQDKFKVNKP